MYRYHWGVANIQGRLDGLMGDGAIRFFRSSLLIFLTRGFACARRDGPLL